MKITEYSKISSLDSDNILLVDGNNGTKKIEASDLLFALYDLIAKNIDDAPLGLNHGMLWRGKNLGSSFTQAQKTAIANGTFDDLWLGDYWTINGIAYRIVDFNYWMFSGRGGAQVTTPHVNVMPDRALYSYAMNPTASNAGAYALSNMRSTGLNNAKTTINNAFGSNHILKHTERFINSVDADGNPSRSDHYDNCTVELPSASMLFNVGTGADNGYITMGCFQFAAFRFLPQLLNVYMEDFWLRDTAVGNTSFKISAMSRELYYLQANTAGVGVRPQFAVC